MTLTPARMKIYTPGMKLPPLSILILSLSFLALSSCVTTPTAEKMKEANAMLKQSEKQAKQGNYSAANNAAAAIGKGVRNGVKLAPVVHSKAGHNADITSLLLAWESGPYKDLRKALAGGQKKAATTAFANLRSQCTNCHVVIGCPEIRLN